MLSTSLWLGDVSLDFGGWVGQRLRVKEMTSMTVLQMCCVCEPCVEHCDYYGFCHMFFLCVVPSVGCLGGVSLGLGVGLAKGCG